MTDGYIDGDVGEKLLKFAGRYWFLLAAAFIVVGGFVYHNDLDIFRMTAWQLIDGGQLYTRSGASYFPLAWYLFSAPLAVAYVAGLPAEFLFPWLATALYMGCLAIAAFYGSRHLEEEMKDVFFGAVFANPLTVFGVVIWSQSDALVVLGVLAGIVSFSIERYGLFGASVAFAASVKIAPAFMLLPGLAIVPWEGRRDILSGAGLVGGFCLLALYIHEALPLVLDPSHGLGIRSTELWYTNPLWGFSQLGNVDLVILAEVLTFAGVFLGVMWAVSSEAPDEVRLLAPLVPAMVFYPKPLPFRWLSLSIPAMWIGLKYQDTRIGDSCWIYGWISATLGGLWVIIYFLGLRDPLKSEIIDTHFINEGLNYLSFSTQNKVFWTLGLLHIGVLVYVLSVAHRTQRNLDGDKHLREPDERLHE